MTVDEAHAAYPFLWPFEAAEGHFEPFVPGLDGTVEIVRGWALYRVPRWRTPAGPLLSPVDAIMGQVAPDAAPNGPYGTMYADGSVRE
jgi:hypothetical protein